jgi:hypothetical protein
MDLIKHREAEAILKRINDLKNLKHYLQNSHFKVATFAAVYVGVFGKVNKSLEQQKDVDLEVNKSDFKCMLDSIDRRIIYLEKIFNKI